MGGKKRKGESSSDSTEKVQEATVSDRESATASGASSASKQPLKSKATSPRVTTTVLGGASDAKTKKRKKKRQKPENDSSSRYDKHEVKKDPHTAAQSIDDIFDGVKQAKKASQEKEQAAKKQREKKDEEEELQRRIEELEKHGKSANRGGSTQDPRPIRFDSELGMNVYSEDSLKINKGGGTPLCPFDCSCCY